MRTTRFAAASAIAAMMTSAPGALVTFNYTQADSVTGAGTIGAFTVNDGGGDINFAATAMPAAFVFNPVPAMTPAGSVGAITAQTGNSNEPNQAVGLLWSGFVTATGTRGANVFTIQIPLRYAPEQNQVPDTNDYNWSIAFGDNPVAGVDAGSGLLRFALFMSRDDVIDAAETSDTFQRYTQINHTFTAGIQDSFFNTDTTTAPIKDATDAGAPAGVDAAGRDLAFYWAWRDQGTLNQGAILVDEFAVGGLLEADEATLRLIPEPSAAVLAFGGASLLFLRRRRGAANANC